MYFAVAESSESVPWWKRRTALLKSVGFEFPFILKLGRETGEEPKVITKTSRRLALARCSVHVIPVSVSMVMIVLNIGNSYLGRGLPGSIIDPSINIALLQVAAKIQELLIVGSMTTVVMQVLRSELISGEGLPLGVIGGSFMYTSLSYFWSPEFWGSWYAKSSRRARFRVFGILLLGGLIALFAGPSTAVLLIPRDQPWPAGGTKFYVSASTQEWWPSSLGVQNSLVPEVCRRQEDIHSAVCLSGGFLSMLSGWTSIDILGKSAYTEDSRTNLTSGFSFGPRTVNIQSDIDILPDVHFHGNHRGFACETSMTGLRLGHAAYQSQLKRDWIQEAFAIPYDILRYGPSLSQYKYFGSTQLDTATQIPAVRTTCSSAQVVGYGQSNVMFPVLPETACWAKSRVFSEVNVTLPNQLSDAPRATWIDLPAELGSTSAGVILELPATQNDSRVVVACSIDARWTPGKVTTYHREEASSLEKIAAQIVVTTSLLSNPVPPDGWKPGYSEFQPVTANPLSKRISLDETWLEALTPNVMMPNSDGASSNLTTLETILTESNIVGSLYGSPENVAIGWNADTLNKVNRTIALEWWVSLVVTDGLSREGSYKVMTRSDNTTKWSLVGYQRAKNFGRQLFANKQALARPNVTNTVEEPIQITIEGYSYRATALTDYASVALLLIHILVACIHTCYSTWTKRSSSSWASLTELMVLMQNSKPSKKALCNTNTGICELKTYSKRAKVYAVQEQPSSGATSNFKHVELVFDEDLDHEDEFVDAMEEHASTNHVANGAADVEGVSSTQYERLSVQNSLHESWTFPISARNPTMRSRLRSVSPSEASDRLLYPARRERGKFENIQSDQNYS